jgi:prophage regulatory protein
MQPLIRPDDLAKMLGVSKGAIYSWCRRGVIPHIRLEKCIRFDPQEIQEWLNDRKSKGA